MSNLNAQTASSRTIIGNGLLIGIAIGLAIGLAGGLAEIAVIMAYSAIAGGDASIVAGEVAAAAGLAGAPAIVGVAVHMALALALGVALALAEQIVTAAPRRAATTFAFMLGSLAIVWAVNFFVVLPAVSPGFVHLLPYAVTFASKLAFGLAAAMTLTAARGSLIAAGHSGAGQVRAAAV